MPSPHSSNRYGVQLWLCLSPPTTFTTFEALANGWHGCVEVQRDCIGLDIALKTAVETIDPDQSPIVL